MSSLGNCTNCGNWTLLFTLSIQKFHHDMELEQSLTDDEKHKKFNTFLDKIYAEKVYNNFLNNLNQNTKMSSKQKENAKKTFIAQELPTIYVPYCCKINMMTTQDKHRILLPNPRI